MGLASNETKFILFRVISCVYLLQELMGVGCELKVTGRGLRDIATAFMGAEKENVNVYFCWVSILCLAALCIP